MIEHVQLGEPSEHQQEQRRKEPILEKYVRQNHALDQIIQDED